MKYLLLLICLLFTNIVYADTGNKDIEKTAYAEAVRDSHSFTDKFVSIDMSNNYEEVVLKEHGYQIIGFNFHTFTANIEQLERVD